MKRIIHTFLVLLLLTSCSSTQTLTGEIFTPKEIVSSRSKSVAQTSGKKYTLKSERIKTTVAHPGVSRAMRFDFYHPDVPNSFNGARIAFVSDFHLLSKYDNNALESTVRLLNSLQPDAVLFGGDYQEGCEYVTPLFSKLSTVHAPLGMAGVMGNNDYERCYSEIVSTMQQYGIRILEHTCDTLTKGKEQIIVAGIRNPFDTIANGKSPSLALHPEDFVILLTHTPDYAEDVDIRNSDLVLAGHTHGGQVTLFGLYAPIVPSHYGQRFLSGIESNTAGIPMIITNGLGTSNKNIRLFAPSEVAIIVLHRGTSPKNLIK